MILQDPRVGLAICWLQGFEENWRSGQSRLIKFNLAANPRYSLASSFDNSSDSQSSSFSFKPLFTHGLELSSSPKYSRIFFLCLGSASYCIPCSPPVMTRPRMVSCLDVPSQFPRRSVLQSSFFFKCSSCLCLLIS